MKKDYLLLTKMSFLPFLMRAPVFWHLLILGITMLTFLLIMGMQRDELIFQLLAIGFGVFIGVSISIFEFWYSKKTARTKYHPTKLPKLVMDIFFLSCLLIKNYRITIGLSLGAYLITLAFIFRIYEIRSRQSGIEWKDILEQQGNAKTQDQGKVITTDIYE